MTPIDPLETECVCGHTEDAHSVGLFRECTVGGCECCDFEPVEHDDTAD
jgi:hypothetical protein